MDLKPWRHTSPRIAVAGDSRLIATRLCAACPWNERMSFANPALAFADRTDSHTSKARGVEAGFR
jgi:hypothetical protein